MSTNGLIEDLLCGVVKNVMRVERISFLTPIGDEDNALMDIYTVVLMESGSQLYEIREDRKWERERIAYGFGYRDRIVQVHRIRAFRRDGPYLVMQGPRVLKSLVIGALPIWAPEFEHDELR